MDLIRMKNVKKTYKNGTTALYDMTLSIEKGEFVFVIGHTGCGKSTLVKMLYREEKPDSGSINVGGIDVTKLRNGKVYKLRRKIGVVFQDFKLLTKLTVYENVAFALEIFGAPKKEIYEKTIKVLVVTYRKHPLYGKRVEYSKKFTAHDENNEAKMGDIVKIMETRPLSKTKKFRLVEIVEKAVII